MISSTLKRQEPIMKDYLIFLEESLSELEARHTSQEEIPVYRRSGSLPDNLPRGNLY